MYSVLFKYYQTIHSILHFVYDEWVIAIGSAFLAFAGAYGIMHLQLVLDKRNLELQERNQHLRALEYFILRLRIAKNDYSEQFQMARNFIENQVKDYYEDAPMRYTTIGSLERTLSEPHHVFSNALFGVLGDSERSALLYKRVYERLDAANGYVTEIIRLNELRLSDSVKEKEKLRFGIDTTSDVVAGIQQRVSRILQENRKTDTWWIFCQSFLEEYQSLVKEGKSHSLRVWEEFGTKYAKHVLDLPETDWKPDLQVRIRAFRMNINQFTINLKTTAGSIQGYFENMKIVEDKLEEICAELEGVVINAKTKVEKDSG